MFKALLPTLITLFACERYRKDFLTFSRKVVFCKSKRSVLKMHSYTSEYCCLFLTMTAEILLSDIAFNLPEIGDIFCLLSCSHHRNI